MAMVVSSLSCHAPPRHRRIGGCDDSFCVWLDLVSSLGRRPVKEPVDRAAVEVLPSLPRAEIPLRTLLALSGARSGAPRGGLRQLAFARDVLLLAEAIRQMRFRHP